MAKDPSWTLDRWREGMYGDRSSSLRGAEIKQPFNIVLNERLAAYSTAEL